MKNRNSNGFKLEGKWFKDLYKDFGNEYASIERIKPIAVITPLHFIITKEFNFTLKYEIKYLDKYYY